MSERVEFPLDLLVFTSINAFYEADPRRKTSGEADYGIYWWDGPQGHSDTWRVLAVEDMGEVYASLAEAYRRHDNSKVVLLGKVADEDPGYAKTDQILEGWNLVCGQDASLQWAIDRVVAAASGRPPLSILVRYLLVGGHVHVDVFAGRVSGSRGKAGELIFREEEWAEVRAGLEVGFGSRLELVERNAPVVY